MPSSLSSTCVSLIPKVDHPNNFGNFRPIALCNMLYKTISKVISLRIKALLFNYISDE